MLYQEKKFRQSTCIFRIYACLKEFASKFCIVGVKVSDLTENPFIISFTFGFITSFLSSFHNTKNKMAARRSARRTTRRRTRRRTTRRVSRKRRTTRRKRVVRRRRKARRVSIRGTRAQVWRGTRTKVKTTGQTKVNVFETFLLLKISSRLNVRNHQIITFVRTKNVFDVRMH